MNLVDWEWQDVLRSFDGLSEAQKDGIEAECRRQIRDGNVVDEQFEKYKVEKDGSDARYNIRTTLIAAFNPRGPIGREGEWTLGRCIPLREFRSHNQHQVDIMIGKSGRGDAIAIVSVVPSEDVTSAFNEAREIAEWILENADTVYHNANVRIDDDEPDIALAVTTNAAEAADEVGDYNMGRDEGRVTIWQFDGADGELIQQYDEQSVDWTPYIPAGSLGETIQEGVKAAENPHTWPDIFLDTHHERVLKNIIVEFAEKSDSEVPAKHFSQKQLEDYLQNNIEQAAQNDRRVRDRAQELVDWWRNIGVIESVPNSQNQFDGNPTAYRFNTSKNSGSGITSELIDKYHYKSALYASEIQIKSQNLPSED